MADEITCLIADDHEVVREGLRLALSRSPRIRVIGEAADGASAVALTERRRPDVVIMDLRMPDMDGLEATEQLLERRAEHRRPHLHRVRRALAPATWPGVRRTRLHPQGGTARDAAPRDREGRRRRDVRRSGPHGRVRLRPGAGGRAHAARAGDPPAPRRRDVECRRRGQALHQPGDREEPRAPHPREARSRHAHAGGRDRAPRGDDRLTADDPERALLAERILAEQEERRRLAELLHDGPVQQLAAIAQMLDAGLADLAAGETERASDVVSRGLTLARDAARDLRALCDDLEPRVLHQLGFAAAAAALARRISSRHDVEIVLDVEHAEELGENAAVALYQILREATEQAVRRGTPSRIEISLVPDRERRRRARRRGRRAAGAPRHRARSARRSRRDAQRPLQLRGAVSARLDHPDRSPARGGSPLGLG